MGDPSYPFAQGRLSLQKIGYKDKETRKHWELAGPLRVPTVSGILTRVTLRRGRISRRLERARICLHSG